MSAAKNKNFSELSVPCIYFKSAGGKNTGRTLEIAANRA